MHSKQVNFYTTEADEHLLIGKIRQKVDFACMPPTSSIENTNSINNEFFLRNYDKIYTIYLCPPKRCSEVKLLFAKDRGLYYVDQMRSPVVEFVRCYHKDNLLRRGRFYFFTSSYEDGTITKKDQDFIRWGSAILRITKNILSLEKTTGDYYGKEALNLKSLGSTVFTFM